MAKAPIALKVTDDERRSLFALLDGRGQMRKIDKGLLARLLTDHQRLMTLLLEE